MTNCPRCGHSQPGGTECARCGVILAKARASRPPPAEQPGTPEPLPLSAQELGSGESSGSGGRLLKLAVFGLVAGLGLYYVNGRMQKSAEEAVPEPSPPTFEQEVDALVQNQMGGAQETAEAFVTGHADLKWALGEPLRAQVAWSNVNAGGAQGSGSMKLTVHGSSEWTTVRVNLVKGAGGWQVTEARYQDKEGNEQELSL